MIEPIMYFGGGFLIASLLALVLISFVHHRAVRLTQRRLEDAIPVSMAEIQADKDNLRAEFAMSARRLEMNVEQLKAKATGQLGEIARKTDAINRLKTELAERTAVTDELDAKAKSLATKIRETEQENAVKAAAIESTVRQLSEKEAELAKAAADINEQRLATDTQRVEIAVLKTQVEQFKSQIEELQQDAQDSARRLFDERVAVSTVTKELEEKRQAVDVLRPQVAQLEVEIATRTSELEHRDRSIADLETNKAELERVVSERDAQVRALHQEIAVNKDEHTTTAARLDEEKSSLANLLGIANTTVESHSARIDELEKWVTERDRLLEQRAAEAQALHQEIAVTRDEHSAVTERLNEEKSNLASLLSGANTNIESHLARIDELEKWVAERDRLLNQRDAEAQALHQEMAAARDEHSAVMERLNEEKSDLASLLSGANTNIESHLARIDELEKWVAERDRLLNQRDAEAQALHQEMAATNDEHSVVVERLLAERTSLERLLQTANHTLETRAARIEDLEKWIAERDEIVRQRDGEIKALVEEIAATKEETDGVVEALRAEKANLETLLQTALQDRTQAQAELTALTHEAEATWRAEAAENVLLRERMNDIAAQVAHMALTMDKSGSVQAILAETASIHPGAFEPGPEGDDDAPSAGNLTERIRKLQNGASRLTTS